MWTKLEKCNDWGADYLAYPGEGLTPDGYAKWSRGLDFDKAKTVRVRWPNGEVTDATIDIVKRKRDVHDMGHVYETTTAEVMVVANVNGLHVHVPILDVEVEYGSIPYRDGRKPVPPPPMQWLTFEEAAAEGLITIETPGRISHTKHMEIDWQTRRIGIRR